MTLIEASEMADRILRTWPRMQIPPDEWRDVLAQLDAGTVGTAYIRLRNDQPRAPSIAEFIQVYRGLATPANMPIREQCEVCGGDGLNTVHETIHGEDYEALVPCRCSNGEGARQMLADVRSRNDAELGRLFPGRKTREPRVATREPRVDPGLFGPPPRADIA